MIEKIPTEKNSIRIIENDNKKNHILVIKKIINDFNAHRSPEITAEFIFIKNKFLRISFSGSFCYACGFYDYFEDFLIELEKHKIKAKTINIKEVGNKILVDYKLI
ncbi:MAG: hypothetical protein ACP5OZ_03230 [Candidatus Woesearchaeota archaeon]